MNWYEILCIMVGLIILAYFLFRRTAVWCWKVVNVRTNRIVILPGPGVVDMIGKPTVDRLARQTYEQLRDGPPGQACVWGRRARIIYNQKTEDGVELAITAKYFVVDSIPTIEVVLGVPRSLADC